MNTSKTNKSKRTFAFFILFFVALSLQFAQDSGSEEKETDPLVLQNLRGMAGFKVWIHDALGAIFTMGSC